MMGFKLAASLLVLLPIALASPVAEAEAAPVAEAEADAEADAGYYGYGGYGHGRGYGYARHQAYAVPHCTVTYDVVTEEQCATHNVPECGVVVKQVPEQVCETHQEQQCHQEQRCTEYTETVHDTTTYEECEDIITQVCTNTQFTSQSHRSVIGQEVGVAHGHHDVAVVAGHVAGHAGYTAHGPGHLLGKREAEADADADAQLVGPANGHLVRASPVGVTHGAPNCHSVPERKCHQVPVSTPRQVVTPHCVAVPVCVAVPRVACHTVARPVEEQVCHPRPVTQCHPVHTKVPRKVCAPVAVAHHAPVAVAHHAPAHHAVAPAAHHTGHGYAAGH